MLPRFFSDVFNGVWAMEKSAAESYIPLLVSILEGNFQKNNIDFSAERMKNHPRFVSFNNGVYSISEYGGNRPPEEAPENSIAVIDIISAVMKYDMECGPAGTKTKSNLLLRADANPNIKGIILNIDSPGGEGYAAMGMSDVISTIEKPVIAFVDDLAASGGAYVATSADWVVANSKTAQFGSFGTYTTIADFTNYFKLRGIDVEQVYATKSTDKNKGYRDAINSKFKDTKLVQESVDIFNERFLSDVRKNRAGKLTDESWSTGKLYFAEEALSKGLIDEIASWSETVNSFAKSLNII